MDAALPEVAVPDVAPTSVAPIATAEVAGNLGAAESELPTSAEDDGAGSKGSTIKKLFAKQEPPLKKAKAKADPKQ